MSGFYVPLVFIGEQLASSRLCSRFCCFYRAAAFFVMWGASYAFWLSLRHVNYASCVHDRIKWLFTPAAKFKRSPYVLTQSES
jgi:hypothetical protein